jgi:hypothetical protein
VLHAQRTLTFFMHWSTDGHVPGWHTSEHRWGQFGSFLWHGPPHDLTLSCSLAFRLLKNTHSKACTIAPQWHGFLTRTLHGGQSLRWHGKGQRCEQGGSLTWNKH